MILLWKVRLLVGRRRTGSNSDVLLEAGLSGEPPVRQICLAEAYHRAARRVKDLEVAAGRVLPGSQKTHEEKRRLQ